MGNYVLVPTPNPTVLFECMNWEIFLYDFPGPVMCTLRAFESAAFDIKSNYLSVISSEPAQAAPTDHNVTFSGMCSGLFSGKFSQRN